MSTLDQATKNARKYLKLIHQLGIKDIDMSYIRQDDIHYLFFFTHPVTKKVATLSTHGYTQEQLKDFVFKPRVFWNGEWEEYPEIEDWLEDGFEAVVTFKEK